MKTRIVRFVALVAITLISLLSTGCAFNHSSSKSGGSEAAKQIGRLKPPKYQPGETASVSEGLTSGAGVIDLGALARLVANPTNTVSVNAATNGAATIPVAFTNRSHVQSAFGALIDLQNHQIDALEKIGVADAEARKVAASASSTTTTAGILDGLLTPSPNAGYIPGPGYHYNVGPRVGYPPHAPKFYPREDRFQGCYPPWRRR